MLNSQIFAARILECDPEQLTLVAVTHQNEAPVGYNPKMWSSAVFECNGIFDRFGDSVPCVSCHLTSPACLNELSIEEADLSFRKSENQRYNPNYPEIRPFIVESWFSVQASEELGISLTSPFFVYDVIVGNPGHYKGAYRESGERLLTSQAHMDDHDVLMKNISHLRFL